MAKISIAGLGRFKVYDETNFTALSRDRSTLECRGYSGRDYIAHPFGSMRWGANPFKLIPEREWKDRIEEGHRKKIFPIYHQIEKKVPILNQKRLPYCWAYAVAGAVQSVRATHGLPTKHLSATSFAAPGKNYREEGGWTGEAIEYADDYGIATVETWPEAVNDRRYFNESREEAKLHNVGQWFELRPKNFNEVMTCLLMGLPVCVGLLWWGHAVFYSAPVWDGGPGVIVDNSWGSNWEDGGRTVLMRQKATPDEANVVSSPLMHGGRV